ncbi:Ser/Thr protein kinase RdoA (MazF antagonist) [Rhodobium orientis]|uniref:Aminoglycoside phosphotransferase domain-containing protein n=1 Tax=Rhodobium orientis TaxID=34017 RepID=A0A327JUN6_9HYPH|nr:phosphotransferase [Rhodobium orientis]MBB4302752.1 Ser/Thr protein kinase RdoA (MazF antagonist) [Rhodobium orientis]MBK5948533.1 hypothetical protein [Rhodobium orientis]RAI29801.1 hypothetical protein CH339_01935 [Rhodobium orientis]
MQRSGDSDSREVDETDAATASVGEATTGELEALARAALPLWGTDPHARLTLINLSENATFLVEPQDAEKTVLRVHREGYHSRAAIESELCWMTALREEAGVSTPVVIPGLNGAAIQDRASPEVPRSRRLVMFEFLAGREPSETDDLDAPFRRLGEISARMHRHVENWQRPAWFERHAWDFRHSLGSDPNWGDWRGAPALDAAGIGLLERQAATMKKRLAAFGQGPERYNLVHADIRLANLLVTEDDTHVLDFDDSGFGWFLYDVATALSFMEHLPQVPDLIEAWLDGYRPVRPLGAEDIAEIPTFLMLRRMIILAWMGSHADTDLARTLGAEYTQTSVELAEGYLSRFE